MDTSQKLGAARGPRKPAKPGFQTSEAYVTIASMLVPWLMSAIPATWAAVITTTAGIAYTVSRTVLKVLGEPAKE